MQVATTERSARTQAWFAGAVLLLSGAAALMHELLWTRRLVDLLGASSESTTRVLGSFFLGLAFGSAIAGLMLPRLRRPWRAAGIAEIAVALFTLLILTLPAWSDRIWLALGPERLASSTGAAVKLLLAVGLVGAPAACMGLVLPFVIAGLKQSPKGNGNPTLWIYAANTLGGVLGLTCLAWLVLPWLQSEGSLLLACALNVLVGGCLIGFDLLNKGHHGSVPAAGGAQRVPGKLLFVAAWSGFGLLAFEVAGAQLVMLFAPLSYYAPAVVLTTLLLMLALAGAVVAMRNTSLGLGAVVMAGGVAVALTPPLFQVAVKWFSAEPAATMSGFTLRMASFSLFCLGPALFVTGLVFPKLLALAANQGVAHARSIAVLIAVNGVGGFVGAEVMNRWLLPSFGIFVSCGVLAVLYVLVAAAVFAHDKHPLRIGLTAIALTLTTLLGIGTWTVFTNFPHYNPNLGFQIIAEIFGRDGPIAVVESPQLGRAILLSNQYILGGTNARADQERQAHLPLALHPQPRDVALIGVATGITPGAATLHPEVNVTAAELSEQIVAAATKHFEHVNHGLARSRAKIVVEDGRTYLASCERKFDVVIGDLFLPWAPGEGRLFSLEHFSCVKRALKPGGLFCQWLPMYQLTEEQYRLIARTFRKAFPNAHLFRGTLSWHQPTLALVGWNDQDLDWKVVEARCTEIRSAEVVRDPVVRSVNGMALMYVGRMQDSEQQGALNTLGNVALELSASRERVTGDPGRKYFYGTRWLEFLATTESGGGQLPHFVREMRQLALQITQWEIAARRRGKDVINQREAIVSRLPRELVQDAHRNAAYWPGSLALFESSPAQPIGRTMRAD